MSQCFKKEKSFYSDLVLCGLKALGEFPAKASLSENM